jgi:hypothetical protein
MHLCADITRRNRIYRWYDKDLLRHEIVSQKVDVLIVDGPPAKTGDEVRCPAIPVFFDRLANQAIVLVDDAGRPEERATVRRWVDGEGDGHFEKGVLTQRLPNYWRVF